jgi:hypothetical protein
MDIRAFLEAAAPDTLIGVYSSEDLSRFIVGTLAAFDDDYVVLNAVDKYGQPDGVTTIALEKVIRFVRDDQYLRVVDFVRKNPISINAGRCAPVETGDDESLLIRELRTAFKNNEPVDLRIDTDEDDTSLTGVIQSVTEDWVAIAEHDGCGIDDGISLVRVDLITRVFRNDRDDVRLRNYYDATRVR